MEEVELKAPKKGKIYFSLKPKNMNTGYRIEDPWKKVNPFFALKLAKFGFIRLTEQVEMELLEKKYVSPESLEEEFRYLVVSNRYLNMDYHLKEVEETLNSGKNVWISSSLLNDFKSFLSQFDGIEVIIEDKYIPIIPLIKLKSAAGIFGLIGKFYSKELGFNARKIGKLQDNFEKDIEAREEELLEVISILKELRLNPKIENLPPANIVNKGIECLELLLKNFSK